MIENPNPTVLALAKTFVLDYLTQCGPKQPSDFDAEVTGEPPSEAFAACLTRGKQPRWNDSIFCNALAALVESGEVLAEDGDQGWVYTVATLAPSLTH